MEEGGRRRDNYEQIGTTCGTVWKSGERQAWKSMERYGKVWKRMEEEGGRRRKKDEEVPGAGLRPQRADREFFSFFFFLTQTFAYIFKVFIFSNIFKLSWELRPSTTTIQKTLGTPGVKQIEFSLKSATFLD